MGSNSSKAGKITAHDRAILDLKVQRDKLKQYNKRVTKATDHIIELIGLYCFQRTTGYQKILNRFLPSLWDSWTW